MVKVRGIEALAGGEHGGIRPGEVKDIPKSLAENDRGTGWVQTGAAEYVNDDYETAEDMPDAEEAVEGGDDLEWPLQTAPADYIERYEDRDDYSDSVAERLELARKLVKED